MCYVHLVLEEVYQSTTELVPKNIAMDTNRELPQYFIQMWQLTYMSQSLYLKLWFTFWKSTLVENISRGLKMEIVFKRRLTNELLTTYLPSLLLLGITYATTYFKPFYFEAALTVNLTVLLVITTLFIRFVASFNNWDKSSWSVMEKLPSTSYVRLVDIWLICGQLIPFIEVILLTLMELYNEEDEINHHGRARKVRSTSKVSFQFLANNKP